MMIRLNLILREGEWEANPAKCLNAQIYITSQRMKGSGEDWKYDCTAV